MAARAVNALGTGGALEAAADAILGRYATAYDIFYQPHECGSDLQANQGLVVLMACRCGVVWWQALGRRTRRWQQWRSCLRATLHNHNHMSRSGSGVGLINGQMQNPILHAAMVMAML